MIRIAALQTCLTIMALLVGASASLAATCADDPNECTPKKLCKEATNLKAGNTVWSKASNDAKHVRFAQGLGMSCGVAAIVDPCDLDANECKISQLCEKATKNNNGQTLWNSAAQGHVDVAKEYGLQCDVNAQTISVKKVCSQLTPEFCRASFVCAKATTISSNKKIWRSPYINYEWTAFLKEAKKRGFDCGVKAETTSSAVVTFTKTDFSQLTLIQRKQIQYSLKALGYYKSSIDGAWGPGTKKAVNKYAKAKRIKNSYPLSIYKKLVSEVKVPTNFKTATKKKTAQSTLASKRARGNQLFECKRQNLPMLGFSTRSAAESWYPKDYHFIIAADESWMASTFGVDKKRTDWEKQNQHLSLTLNVSSGGSYIVSVPAKALSDQKESFVYVSVLTDGNTQRAAGAKYKCGKGQKTSWEPD